MTKLYLAASPQYWKTLVKVKKENPELKLLTSFFFLQDGERVRCPVEFLYMLDSGAYSAKQTNSVINIEEYISFIRDHENEVGLYFNLDVIGDPITSQENLDIMEYCGLSPIPTYHITSPLTYLKEMVETGYNYIAIGGAVPLSKRKKVLHSVLHQIFSIIPKSTKVHLFGLTSSDTIHRFRPYSIDSSSWASGGRFGCQAFYRQGIITTKKLPYRVIPNSKNEFIHERDIMEWLKYANYLEKIT